VIRADVEFVDLDSAQWAVLNELVLEARRLRRWGYVMHADGYVLTRHPVEVAVAPGEPVGDLSRLARRLRAGGGFDRVVLIDRTRLPALARAGAELVEPDGDLTRYRERVDALYWSFPGVVTDPAPPANPWLEMRLRAEALGSGLVHVDVYDEGRLVTAIALRVDGGSVTRISSPSAEDEPDVVLAIGAGDLVGALRSAGLVAHLLDAARRNPLSRGLPLLDNDVPDHTTPQEGLPAHAS
jgi:hypothetical protein